jgi:hypothetical protein
MRSRSRAGLGSGAAGALVALVACASHDDGTRVSVAPTLIFTKGLLDGVTKLTMQVYDAAPAVACDPATGRVTLTGKVDPFLTKDLGPCSGGRGRFCGQLEIAKKDSDRVFAAIARAGATEVAGGCAVAKVNQNELPLEIKMVRLVPPSVCGNGNVEPAEQCEPAGSATDPMCDESCHTKEIRLSTRGSGTVDGNPGQKTSPWFLWPSGTGNAGRFFAFYSDAAASSPEISMRVMSEELLPVDTPSTAFQNSLFVPSDTSTGEFPPTPNTGDQSAPAAVRVGSKYYVVFQDNGINANGLDVRMRSLVDTAIAAEQPKSQPYIGINGAGGNGEANAQEKPAVAASGLSLFIAWQDRSASKVFGRTYNTQGGALGTQQEIGNGANVKVAARPNGWVAVWSDGASARVRTFASDGTPGGAPDTVNEGGSAGPPSVASLPDGRFAVAFANGSDVFVQRYAVTGAKVAGDQAAPVNDLVKDGEQSAPAITALGAAGGAYAVAWVDEASGHVRARYLGGSSGFLFNNVDGQPTEFQASVADGRTRANPAVASGGSGPFVAIGWEDKSPNPGSGIVVRRFPAPQ